TGRAGGTAYHDRQLRLLVPRGRQRDAQRALETVGWRYAWKRAGLMRLAPSAYYWWDGGVDLELCWGDACAPLPPAMLRGVTAALWRGARAAGDGTLDASDASLLVHLAVQACRPGTTHDDDWAHFQQALAHASAHDASARDAGARDAGARDEAVRDTAARGTAVRETAMRLAREAGVSRAVARALAAADAQGGRPGAAGVFDGWREGVWRVAWALVPRVATPQLQRVLSGAPQLGDVTVRCRVRGVEVLAEPGVFVPTPDADLFVELARAPLTASPRATVVEVGTGCGAIALAIAQEHPTATVHGTDLFAAAVASARRNASRLALDRVRFHRGSLLDPLPSALAGTVELLIANLPFYPAQGYAAIGSVPRATIQGGGDDGLDLVRTLARDARRLMRPGGRLVLQMFATQWATFTGELAELGYRPGDARPFGPFVIGVAERPG
ncbi:MAG TPA: methyltransferase domain-containing protein, partial [Gemmatimonadaceae bacterium]|nr:methyltransferase domain-containing protein [Gemmatimonadaceae bacterium]